MITNRSNHMPMLMKMQRIQINTLLFLTQLDQKNCGMSTLQLTIAKEARQNGPNAGLMNVKISNGLPEYQAMKNSLAYARPTIMPVASMMRHIAWMCAWVMMCCRLNRNRSGIISVSTIAKPEKMAPATKYGGKIVVCQPGSCDTGKSNEKMECTERTSGVEKPPRIQN